MRLICPHCMSGVTVPDDAAGKDATCPNCGKTFPTPPRYSATVVPDPPPPPPPLPTPEVASAPAQSPPAPPPGYVPPVPAGTGFLPSATPQAAGGEIPVATGYAKSIGITFSLRVVAVLPAVFLTLALVFTFFPWVGTYYAGSSVYSQGPWRAMFGSVSRNTESERAAPLETIGWTDKVPSDWYLMLPFLLALLAAAALALADRGLSAREPQRIPAQLAKIWPVRHMVIAVLSVIAVALVLIQSLNGFGLERGAQQVVQERMAKEREEAKGDAKKSREADQKEEDELRKFRLSRTYWMHFAVLFTAFGALAAVGTIVLERRGNKPPPKLLLHY